MYKSGAIVILESSLLYRFGEIKNILVFGVDEYFLVVQEYTTECFVSQFHSYDVTSKQPPVYRLCQPKHLVDYHPLSAHV